MMSNAQKKIVFIFVFILSLFLVYKLAIQKTIDLKKEQGMLLQEKALLDNANAEIEYLNKKRANLEAFLKENKISVNSSFQQILLQKITAFSDSSKIEILAFNEPHTVEKNGTILETYSFEVKGNYSQMLKLVNFLENSNLGELASVNFEKRKNYRTRQEYLTMKVYISRFKSDEF